VIKRSKNLPLGKDVQKVIADCFQDWTGAIEWSIDHVPDPPGDSSWLDWGISLAGNMLWAVTVFFREPGEGKVEKALRVRPARIPSGLQV
jgi:hypothetical protein